MKGTAAAENFELNLNRKVQDSISGNVAHHPCVLILSELLKEGLLFVEADNAVEERRSRGT